MRNKNIFKGIALGTLLVSSTMFVGCAEKDDPKEWKASNAVVTFTLQPSSADFSDYESLEIKYKTGKESGTLMLASDKWEWTVELTEFPSTLTVEVVEAMQEGITIDPEKTYSIGYTTMWNVKGYLENGEKVYDYSDGKDKVQQVFGSELREILKADGTTMALDLTVSLNSEGNAFQTSAQTSTN